MDPTLNKWIDESMRQMRQKYRDMFNAWVGLRPGGTSAPQGDNLAEIIEKAEDLQVKLKSFIGYLQNVKKFG